jgi:hypothetical protein
MHILDGHPDVPKLTSIQRSYHTQPPSALRFNPRAATLPLLACLEIQPKHISFIIYLE